MTFTIEPNLNYLFLKWSNLTTLKTTSLDVDEALSDYKPQIDFYSNLIQIDGDKAKYSSGL